MNSPRWFWQVGKNLLGMVQTDSNLAVVMILVNQDKILLLKRTQEPICWGPPSGRIHVGEPIEDAVHRELKEETALTAKIIMPVQVWQGPHRGVDVTAITYVCETSDYAVVLSDEHSAFQWICLDKLTDIKDTVFDLKKWPALIKAAKAFIDSSIH